MGVVELQRLADAAGFATASDDALTADAGDASDAQPVRSAIPQMRLSTPDDPRPRSNSTALVPAQPLWQASGAAASQSLLGPGAQTALRNLSAMILRSLPARA
jgi:hypothetical protein